MSKTTNLILVALTMVTMLVDEAQALLVKLTDLHTMAKRSDVVVHGIVGEIRVAKDELGRNITLSEIEVIDGLYGAKTGAIIEVYQVGGTKDGVSMPVIGGQRYRIGQEIFFFGMSLGKSYVSYGAGQGKFDIEKIKGKDVVIEDLGDVMAIHSAKNREPFVPTPLYFPEKELLKSEIRGMLKMKHSAGHSD